MRVTNTVARVLAAGAGLLLASAGLAIVLVIFMLIQREDLRNRLIRFVGYGRLTFTTRALEEAGQRISRYLLMQTIINSSFGLAVGLTLYLIGVPYAVLWGFFAAVLRFIRYVGPLAWRFSKVGCGRSWLWESLWLWNSSVIWFWSLCFIPRAQAFRGLDF